jgi:hypothetical protein
VDERQRQPDDEMGEGARAREAPPSRPRRPPSPFYRHRVSSISITEPVGLLAPLLAVPPPERDEEPAAGPREEVSRPSLPPSSVEPVTVAHTQSVPIPLNVPTRHDVRHPSPLTAVALGAAGALVLAAVVLVSTIPARRHRPASVASMPAEPMARSFVAPIAIPAPAQPAAAAPGAGVAPVAPAVTVAPVVSAAATAAQPTPKSKTGSQTVVVLPRSSIGHRIYVDGRVVGSGPEPVTVKCGRHSIKIGSAGKAHLKDLPCGGEITLIPN